MRQWLSPLLLRTVETFQKLTEDIDTAHTIHLGKKEMKIQEDPWDNYLYYDSRYIIPIFCNQESMTIEKQVLAVYFMHRTIADETISQFKDMGGKLLTELFRFINEDFVDTSQLLADEVKENESSLLERIRLACQDTELQAE
jgi:hypothetical protein